MNLEVLPDEILLDLFDYFNGTDLLLAFHNLNSRFDYLLYNQFRQYHFKFISMSKRNFDMICQQHLPLIVDRVISLSFAGVRTMPEQIDLFLTYASSFSQFTQLQSLSLHFIRSYTTLMKILDQCHHLYNLIQLHISTVYLPVNQYDFQLIINSIWSLPKLMHCKLNINIQWQGYFLVPTNISASLESIFIYRHLMKLNDINRLFQYTPCLKRLYVSLDSSSFQDYIPFTLSILTDLHVCIHDPSEDLIMTFLQNTPNLFHLNIDLWSTLINGHQWQQIISKYLPKLQVFKLNMKQTSSSDQHIQEHADKLINSFRSSFWIYEHQWFVRCITQKKTIYLHTLSKKSHYFRDELPDSLKSTCPHEDYQEFYNSITTIDETFFDQLIPSYVRLPNIKSLYIKLPISDQFWSIVPNLNRLDLLLVSSHADTFHSQLQALLEQASHLRYLIIHQDASLPLQTSLFRYTNASVRTLNLEEYNHSFNEEECIKLSQSPLGVQCEELSIQVENRESIISLVKNMINLRSLNVQCEAETNCKHVKITEDNDELVQWLKHHLSPTCLIVRNPNIINIFSIWI